MKTTETDLYVLEWSRMHGATNVQPLESTLSSNRADYRDNRAASDMPNTARTPEDEAQRNRILEHCRFMYALDKDYANWAFDNYARMLPWLKLERKQ